jgi:predicted membrane-bound dolichyl-phosphate-mannose-protein mannosyltransferase
MRNPRAPAALLALLCVLSLAARAAGLGEPCVTPCRTADAHVLVFDEQYYINAARVIAGLRPPPGATYGSAPLGEDPNSEHPQLAKLLIAGSIELFGDGPLAWRLGSLVFGTLAIVGIFALARAAGGNRWLALGAAALMAFDNLMIVHGRIGTLDIYVLAAMIWSAVLYLRGRPLAAGVLVGVGACFKLVGLWALLVFALVETAGLVARARRGGPRLAGARRLAVCTATASAVFFGLLDLLDQLAPPFDASKAHGLAPGPFHHLAHMISFGATQTSPHGARGIASYPWDWLLDLKPIVYLNVNPARPSVGLRGVHPAVHFLGMINPAIMLLALPALLVGAVRMTRGSSVARAPVSGPSRLGMAWFLATFVPFLLLSAIWQRTSYLYYMLVVMPGIYLVVADFVYRQRDRQRLVIAWGTAVIVAAVVMYPFTPLP